MFSKITAEQVVAACEADDFDTLLQQYLCEVVDAESLEPYCDSYADDIEISGVHLTDLDEEYITAEFDVEYSDCTATGCSNVTLSESACLHGTIRICRVAPYDIVDLDLGVAWDQDGDIY